MLSGKSRRVVLPAFALVVAILGTASLMLFTTLRSLESDRLRMENELQRQGLIVIRTLESSARTGMMMRWGREQIEALVTEASRIGEIAYIGIFDEKGEAVARQDSLIADPPWPEATEIGELMAGGEPRFRQVDAGETAVFEVSRKFVPRRPRNTGGMMRSRMGRVVHPELTEEWVIVLGLHRGPWEKILADGRRQSLLSFLVIVIAGSMALYIGIVLQNFLVVRRTLAEMETYAGSILRNMADGLVSVGRDGRIASGNAEAARILGVDESSLTGKDPGAMLPEAAAALAAVLEGKRDRVEDELSLERADGRMPVGLAISPLGDAQGGGPAGAVLLLRDLTELRRLERRFREAEKLAAVGQMAATVAHEIRNPLSSLKGFAQLFEGKFPAGSREAGYAGLMVQEVERLNRTISDLLFFSRPMELQKKPVDLGVLIRETTRLLAPDIEGAGQTIDLEGVGDLSIAADDDQLRRVLLNVMINAHQAAGRGGRIVVTTANDGEGEIVLNVTDSGPGISEEDARRAFEPFFTTREKGSGLGLAIVRKIIELHGGTASIAAAAEGTTVTVRLPGGGGEQGDADGQG
jgi:two-component system sensor histidine kinase HydH